MAYESALERARRLTSEAHNNPIVRSRLESGLKPEVRVSPNDHEQAILRRVARGCLLRTIIDGKPKFTYEDGAPISRGRFSKHEPDDKFSQRDLERFVCRGWLVPDQGDALPGAPFDPYNAQVYRSQTL